MIGAQAAETTVSIGNVKQLFRLIKEALNKVERAMSNLNQGKTAGPDRLTADIFKDDCPALAGRLAVILSKV